MKPKISFFQLFDPESCSYTYIIGDRTTRDSLIIDPVFEQVERDLLWLKENSLNLRYILDTHIHADHVTAAKELKNRTDAKYAVSSRARVSSADIQLTDGMEINLSSTQLKVLETPGHTHSCLSYYFPEASSVFTGDTLLIRGCGRTDFQNGSAELLYESITEKLYTLPDETTVYPGHDYRGFTSSTIGVEKIFNSRIRSDTSKKDFVQLMKSLKLAHPRKIHETVPANLLGGEYKMNKKPVPDMINGVPTFKASQIKDALNQFRLVDVRRPEEFNNELGHIPGAELFTLGDELESFLQTAAKDEAILFICRSGGRSHEATSQSIQAGFKNTANLAGGMLMWNESKYPIER